ncbi:putative membrane protein ActII-3 [Actinomadura rubrobrunea]|uniref:Membrane protein ActII-3 n=1 Tax=Actinomadura rubrobrunea TaxID=115335 RepID=A0A9W6PVF2_9ACTN|nr:MMPL family transporter [Actinomadura rubrobrunea]GLW63926.1 putative membrane protein ActII-3 [Actinomadura rubrobrunea]
MSRLLAFPAGRRAKWIVLVAWLIVLGAVGPFAGRLFGAADNDRLEYLPKSAESTEVLKAQEAFPQGQVIPAMIVYERDSGLTQADRQRAAADAQRLTREFAPQATPQTPQVSKDGKAMMFVVPLAATGDEQEGEVILDAVDGMRKRLGDGEGGLEIKVAGPAGMGADEFLIFRDMEFTLVLIPVVVVAILLLLIYRSPVLFLVPLFTVAAANQLGSAIVYGLIKGPGMVVNSMAVSVLSILIYGAGTDYALLLIARYREELTRHGDRHEAMAVALRRSGGAIIASAGTVGLGLLCLGVADLNSTRTLAPVGALGILSALVAMLTLLPALLLVFGRWIFWPRIPHQGDVHRASRAWTRVGELVAARARPVWITTAAVLAVGLLGLLSFHSPQQTRFTEKPDALKGQEIISAHFSAGAGNPADVIANADRAEQVKAAALAAGATSVQESGRVGGKVQMQVTLPAEPESSAERDAVERLRDRLHAVPGADARVGGPAAIEVDMVDTIARDSVLTIPLVLGVILLVLCALLRAITMSLLLIATVVLSFGAAMGISTAVFEHVFHWYGQDPQLPQIAFVFLVALGVDYNIFLVSRVREEAKRHGTRRGTINGLVSTGGVITSAGIVLAATFSVLITLPVVSFAAQGFVVALGVLIDTFIVRSLLVPALTHDLGDRLWWPSGLARGAVRAHSAPEPVAASERRR